MGTVRAISLVKGRAPGARALPAPAVAPVTEAAMASARAAGLRYTSDTRPGIRRTRHRGNFRYFGSEGRRITSAEELGRIRSLVIPPAWEDVWICPDPRGHLQATGRDARGRKQYRYHPKWREIRDETKYDRMIGFAQALPLIRERTDRDLKKPGVPREKVLGTVVQLLEKTLIRVGNDEYAKQNRSFGLTTLRDGHVDVRGGRLRFTFRGKSGIEHEIDLDDRRLAKIVRACRDIPGYDLFQFYDEQGKRQVVGSADVNAYLKELTGEEYTSKDFRTWAGTVHAAQLLRDCTEYKSAAEAKRHIVRAVESVAKRLGNTKAVSRKCYIHPAVLDSYTDGPMIKMRAARARRSRSPFALSECEAAVLALLQGRQPKQAKRKAS
jgi:DNA topoisomerase-1